MLLLSVLFFVSLAVGVGFLAWHSHAVSNHELLTRFVPLSLVCLLVASLSLFAGMSIFTPNEPSIYLPTLLVAQAVPVAAVACALAVVHKRWSRRAKLALSSVLSAAFSVFAIGFILVSTCAVQSNCL
jgi:hypothetical protein